MTKESKDKQMTNIFLFHGEESFLTLEKISFWKKKFIEKYDENNISELDAESITLGEILQNCESMPFLSDKRLVIIKNIFSSKKSSLIKDLAANLDRIPDFCILVISHNQNADKRTSLYKKIKKNSKVEEFSKLEGKTLLDWIQSRTRKQKSNISISNANYLILTAGNDLWKLKNEIDKLSLYTRGRDIQMDDIDKLVSSSLNTNIFKFTDNLSQKRQQQALKNLHNLSDHGEDLFMIFHMIIRQFRILIQIKDQLEISTDPKKIISELKLHPFVVKKAMQQSHNYSMEKLKNIYHHLLKIEIGIKTGRIKSYAQDAKEFQLALDRFVIQACKG